MRKLCVTSTEKYSSIMDRYICPIFMQNYKYCLVWSKLRISPECRRCMKLASKKLQTSWHRLLKLVSAIFYQIFTSYLTMAFQKLWKMFFISFKKLSWFSRYSNFVFLSTPLFPLVSHSFIGWSKINLKVNNVINYLDKNFTFCLISWEGKKGMTLELCKFIEY